jgi:hypothetical protein
MDEKLADGYLSSVSYEICQKTGQFTIDFI